MANHRQSARAALLEGLTVHEVIFEGELVGDIGVERCELLQCLQPPEPQDRVLSGRMPEQGAQEILVKKSGYSASTRARRAVGTASILASLVPNMRQLIRPGVLPMRMNGRQLPSVW